MYPKGSENVNRMNDNRRKMTHTRMMNRVFAVIDTFWLESSYITDKALLRHIKFSCEKSEGKFYVVNLSFY